MINHISEIFLKKNSDLSSILAPVSSELKILEGEIAKSLSSNNPLLEKIAKHVFQAGGKRLRPAISFFIAKAINNSVIEQKHYDLAVALELVHTATLIHDDVLDNAETRRGILTINKQWSDKTAVIAGDFLLAKALIKLSQLKKTEILEIFANILNEICEGEIQQNSDKFEIISIENYIEKSKRKTAKLFVAGAQSAAVLSCEDDLVIKAAREYALNFGIAFQIADDILNFTGKNSLVGKPAGLDLKNGIITAPVLFAIKEYEQQGSFILTNLLKSKLKCEKDFNLALKLVLESSGIQQTEELAQEFVKNAITPLEYLPDNIYKESLINLANYVITRKF